MSATLKNLRRSLFLISAPMVFIMFGLPLRAEDLGASGFQIGVLYAIFTASLIVLRPLVGIGVDFIGRRSFFIAALVFYLVANILYAFSESLDSLYIARALQGVGFSFLAITTDTITADLTEREGRSAAMGANIASQSRGGMAGAFIGFTLVGVIPNEAWQYSFAIYSVIAVLGVIFAWRFVPETLNQEHKTQSKARFKFPAKYYRLLLVIFLAAFAAAVIQPYYLVYLRGRLDLEVTALAAVFIPVGIAYAILPIWLGKITGRINRALTISMGLVIAAGFYVAVPHIDSFIWLITAFTGAAIGSVLIDLTKNAWIADISGAQATGRTFGLVAFVAGAGAALGPLAGGAIYDGFGKDYIFYFAGAVFLFALLLALRFIRKP